MTQFVVSMNATVIETGGGVVLEIGDDVVLDECANAVTTILRLSSS